MWSGNSRISGPDPFFDEWFCRAAGKAFLTTEEIVPTAAFDDPLIALQMPIERNLVHGVALAGTARTRHPARRPTVSMWSICAATAPRRRADGRTTTREYVAGVGLEDYVEAVGGAARIDALPLPVF